MSGEGEPLSIEDLCVGDALFFNTKSGDDVSPLGGDGGEWAADTGDALVCRRDTPRANEIRQYAARGHSLDHQFFFAASVVDLSAMRDNPQAYRLHWTSTRNGTAIDRYLWPLAIYMEDSPDDDPEMEMWIVDASEKNIRNDDNDAEAS